MKTVGIIGGIGPASTIVYYRSIVTLYRHQKPDGSYPSIIINSIDLTRMLGLIGENRLIEVTSYLVEEVKRLAKAGADFGLLAANTPHIVFDDIQRQSLAYDWRLTMKNYVSNKSLQAGGMGKFHWLFTVRKLKTAE